MLNRTRIAVSIAALAVAAFAVVGCGSDDGGSSDSGSASTSSVSASTPAATTATAPTATAPTATDGSATGKSGSGGSASGSPTLNDVLQGIHSVLVNQGLDPKVAQCIEDELGKSLTEEDVKDINGTAPPPGFQQKIAAAAQACNGGG
jgi:hypothetical protein